MDAFSLGTASTYINNLLLARGLLHNGKPVEFAKPSKGEGGTEATMAQIINIVHDLILRRDREQEQRETLVQTIRSLRSEATHNTSTTEKMQTKNEDLNRQLSLCQSQERAARAAMRSAESSARVLREEMLRLKATVTQVRTACANDVRKRDVQIQKLKTHLTAQQRGNKTGLVGASITITPGTSGGTFANGNARDEEDSEEHDTEWSLKQETNEMLTQLSQSLGEENNDLTSLLLNTLNTLKELQGSPEIQQQAVDQDAADHDSHEAAGSNMVQTLPASYESLAIELDATLQSLKTLLTNPNFVSIDEVTLREEEIGRLRAGFERLESRWREALALMNSWRERMANGGDTVNLEELKEGLGLGVGFGASVMVRPNDRPHLSGIAEENSEVDEPDFDSAMEDEELPPAPSPHVLETSRPKSSNNLVRDVKLAPTQVPLKEAHGNVASPPRKKRKSACAEDGENENIPDVNGTTRQAEKPAEKKEIPKPTASRLPRKTTKRSSSPERHAEERMPKLTVQEKLGLTQAEADDAIARVDHAAEAGRGVEGQVIPTKVKRSPSKKARVLGRPKRRKSTLTRDEMADLLAGLID